MGSLSCTFNGWNTCSGGTVWGKSSFSTEQSHGYPGYGANRAIVIKFTTPSFSTSYTNKKITVNLALGRYTGNNTVTSGEDTFEYKITTSVPSFSSSPSTNMSGKTFITSDSKSLKTGAYASHSLTTSAGNFAPSTTYYLWIYSSTPTGSTIGYFSNSSTYGGPVTVSIAYDEVQAKFYTPSADFYGYTGYYHGAQLKVTTTYAYPYIYASSSQDGGIAYKGTASGTTCIIDVAQDTSSTSKTVYIIASNQPNLSEGEYPGSNNIRCEINVPRYACRIYYFSSEPTVCTWTSTSGTIDPVYYGAKSPKDLGEFSGYSKGTLSTSIIDYGTISASSGVSHNGQTYYARGSATTSVNCYLGRSSPDSINYVKYWYGAGETSVTLDGGEPSRECMSDGSYKWQGWAITQSTTYQFSEISKLAAAGHTKAYGVYMKGEVMKYFPQNGQSSSSIAVSNFIYGAGEQTKNYPKIPLLEYDGYTFIGWAITSDGAADTLENRWDNGYRELYAIWVREGNVYYCPVDSNSWILAEVYYGYDNGTSVKWVPVQVKCEDNLTWK